MFAGFIVIIVLSAGAVGGTVRGDDGARICHRWLVMVIMVVVVSITTTAFL